MNSTVVEHKIVWAKQRSIIPAPRENPTKVTAKWLDVPQDEMPLRIAKILEQRIAPQHWGINE